MAIDDTWHDRSTRNQKAAVARWFGAVSGQPAFFAADGRAYPLSPSELAGLKQAAEDDAVRTIIRFEQRMWLIGGLILTSVIVGHLMLSGFPELLHSIINWSLAALWTGHGVWMLLEGLKAHRDTQAIRDDVECALRPRLAIRDMGGERRFADPWTKIALWAGFGLFGLAIVAEAASHFGVDMISAIPPWIFLAMVPLFLAIALGSKISLARRGRD